MSRRLRGCESESRSTSSAMVGSRGVSPQLPSIWTAAVACLITACGASDSVAGGADATVGGLPPGWSDPDPRPATACERTLPIHGSSCAGTLECTYAPGGCEANSATCSSGKWRVTLGACPKCPPPSEGRPANDATCDGGKGCRFLNACGGVDIGQCVGGRWVFTQGACHKGCPPARPVQGSSCGAISAETCTFAGSECSTSECSCTATCPRTCAEGVVLTWFCPEPTCGPGVD